MVDIRKSWEKIAGFYSQTYLIKTTSVHYGPLCPGEDKLSLLGDISGLKVIDLGCGAGQNCIALAKLGAKVTGVDYSANQLSAAREFAIRANASIEFIKNDMTNLAVISDRAYDIAVSACAMAFVKDFKAALAEAYRILKPGGKFILSVMHPVQYILDGEKNRISFNSTYPFEPRLIKWRWDFGEESIKFQYYLRSISEYHNSLVGAGFAITRILEPKPTLNTPHIGFSKEIMSEYPHIARHLPITLIFVAFKPSINQIRGRHG